MIKVRALKVIVLLFLLTMAGCMGTCSRRGKGGKGINCPRNGSINHTQQSFIS
jgi:hypothetical protein